MKHIKHWLMTMAVLLCSITASAQTKVEIDGIWYNLITKGKVAEVTYKGDSYDSYYNEYSGSITIPATVTHNGVEYSVTSIGDGAFYYCSSLTSIILPESVTSIGESAFSNCSSLTAVHISDIAAWCNIEFSDYYSNPLSYAHNLYLNGELVTQLTLPESVTSIGRYAFYKCSSLTAITIPEGVTSIGNWAFSSCSSLTAITIPEGVTSIGDRAFSSCSSLTAITIPESVTSIGDYAFADCSSLTAITIPESVTSIGRDAFSYCISLTTITIPEGVTSIGGGAFFYCISLTTITISESVTRIEESTFSYCISLTSITIPEGVTSIGRDAFGYCSGLTAITIPEDVTSIGDYAFRDCSSLTAIVLPKSLKNIGSQAFANCSELLDVYCYAEKVPSTKTDAFNGSFPEYAILHVPASAIETYKTTAPWSIFGTITSTTNELVTGIALSQQSATMTEGTTLTLTATIAPIYATDRTLTWSSSNTSVATVDNGKVTAIAPGTATITATANDGSGVKASCVLIVEETLYIKITINQYGSATYCSEYALDFSRVEGLKAYAAAGYNKKTGVVTLLRVNTTQPETGIFLKGEPGKKYEVPVIEESDDNVMNMLVGTLTPTQVNEYSADGQYRNYKYTIKEGDAEPKFYQFTNGSTMGAGKAYLQIPTAWLPAGETRSIGLRFDEGEGTTDMEEFTIDNSSLTIIYDLYGRCVAQPVKGSLYIVNGRKVVY